MNPAPYIGANRAIFCGHGDPSTGIYALPDLRITKFLDLSIVTYILTSCSRVLLEKLTGFQLVKKLPAFYRTPSFITAFTSARHLSVS
jgi:hypothetical protein